MREKYESLALTDLREIAKARGIKGTSAMKKADIVEAMLAEDEKDKTGTGRAETGSSAEECTEKFSGSGTGHTEECSRGSGTGHAADNR